MRRRIPPFFALSLVASALLPSAGVQATLPGAPLWRVPETSLLGFRQDGLPVTRTFDRAAGKSLSRLDVREPANGKVVATVDLVGIPPRAYLLAFTSDLKYLAWEDSDRLTVVTPTRRWTAKTPGLRGTRGLLFGPDGQTLAVANEYGYVQLWDTGTGTRRTTLLFRIQPPQMLFSPDGQTLAVNEHYAFRRETSLSLWSKAGKPLGKVAGVNGASRGAFEFSADGQEILVEQPGYVLGWVNLRDGTARRWQSSFKPCSHGRQCVACAKVCRYALHATLTAARERALVWTSDGAAMLYDARAGTFLRSLPPGLNSAKLSPDGRQAYKWGYDEAARATSLRAWKLP